ncbi:hypothetical protein EDB89DRAFT_2247200 [Lactarius sanguifluus]|nr:hypothetical protein EDB89DRAFT_2247200 [Lactarius sanguifluus]
MAQLLRTPKSGNDWTANELCAYNITVVPQSKEVFFGTIDFPDPTEPSMAGFMVAETRQDATDKRTKQLLHYSDLEMDPKIEAAVVKFSAQLLRGLEYDEDNRIRRAIPFLLVEKAQSPRLTSALWTIIMKSCCCCREDKILTSMNDLEPRVIAEAMLNNRKRELRP